MPVIRNAKGDRRVDTDALLAALDLAAVATGLMGPPPGRRGERGRRLWWPCPFHADGNPSFCVTPGKLWWRCYGCGEKGTAIDLAARIGGLGFIGACKALADTFGVDRVSVGLTSGGLASAGSGPIPKDPIFSPSAVSERLSRIQGGREKGDRDKETTTPKGLPAPDALALAERAEVDLWTRRGADALEQLRARGLSDDTTRKARLGWTPPLETPGWPRGIVLPWFDRDRLKLLKVRQPERRKPKYSEVFRDDPVLYVAAPVRPGLPVIVTEGEFDAILVAQEVGHAAGVVTVGSASGPISPAVLSRLLAASVWLVATDADGAGDDAAGRWFAAAPYRCVRIRPPGPGKDWTDVHAGGFNRIRYHLGRFLELSADWSVLEAERWGSESDADEPSGVLGDPSVANAAICYPSGATP